MKNSSKAWVQVVYTLWGISYRYDP